MNELDPKNKRIIYYGVAGFAISFMLFRGCAIAEQERMMKYVNFHQDNFVKLCSENYEDLAEKAKRECDKFFVRREDNSF